MSADPSESVVTLALDAATYVGSVAVVRGAAVLAECEVGMRGEREERLMPAVADALRAAGLDVGDVGRVFCGAGPGSFTSLRIAASIAKGFAAAARLPLYASSSLVLVIAGAWPPLPDGEYVVALDALRGEVYASAMVVAGGVITYEPAARIRESELQSYARSHRAPIAGPGRDLDLRPHARGALRATSGLVAAEVVDLASWEPDYGRLAEAQVRWEAAHGRPLESA